MATGALIGALRVTLGLDTAAFEQGIGLSQKQMAAFQRDFATKGASIAKAGVGLSAAITAPFAALVAKAIPAAIESAQATAQVNAALASMGPAAGRSSDQLAALAGRLQSLSLFDDDDIMVKVTANLLTFGKVSGDVFDRAEAAIVDISARMGTDLQSATIMVGKALNDPVKGLKALGRAGIQFSDEQKTAIAAMVETGNVAGAQKVMLGELERQFHGAAKAQRDATPSAAMQEQWRTLQENVGALAMKVLPPLLNAVGKVLTLFNKLPTSVQTGTVALVAAAAAFGPVLVGLGGLVTVAGTAAAPLAGLAVSMGLVEAGAVGMVPVMTGLGAAIGIALPFIAAAAGAVAAVYAAYQHWNEIAPILTRVWTAISTTFGPPFTAIIDGVQAAVSGLVNGPFGAALAAIGDLFTKRLGEVGAGAAAIGRVFASFASAVMEGLGPALRGVIEAFGTTVGTAFRVVGDLLNTVAALLRGDFSGAWTYAQKTVSGFAMGMAGALTSLVPNALESVNRLVTGVAGWLGGRLGAIFDGVRNKIQWVGDKFKWLDDVVVRHSYIPDMVDSIGEHMARLQGNMVAPVKAATETAAQAFARLQQQVGPIMDRLFPEQARQAVFEAELKTLETSMAKLSYTAEQTAEAVSRLRGENIRAIIDSPENRVAPIETGGDPDDFAERMTASADRVAEGVRTKWADVGAANDNLATSFTDLTKSVADALGGLATSIKSGDWMGAVRGVLDVVTQLGQSGVFGKSFQARLAVPVAGARAAGGPVSGGLPYLVGERGPEIVVPRSTGTVIPNHAISGAMGGGGVTVNIHANDAVLTSSVKTWVAQGMQIAAAQGAAEGKAGAIRHFARRADRRVA